MLTDPQLQEIYAWVDSVPLSRPKKNINRDFSDAVLLAELIHHYQPKLVDLHNYPPANALSQKVYNWNTLNQKVLRRLDMSVDVDSLAQGKQSIIEDVLWQLRERLERRSNSSRSSREKLPPISASSNSQISYPMSPQMMPPPFFFHPQQYQQNQFQQYSPQPYQQQFPVQFQQPMQQPTSSADTQKRSLQLKVDEKQKLIDEMKETMEVMQLKITKLEQLLELKERKIEELQGRRRW